MTTSPVPTVAESHQLDLAISGMTCGACALKVEKALNQIDGVTATVNFATESARITTSSEVSTERIIARVEEAGYGARRLEDTTPEMLDKETMDRVAMLRARLVVSLIAGVPVVALSMIPALEFDGWKWWHWCSPSRWWCGRLPHSTRRRR